MKFEGQKLQYDFPKMREGAVKRRLELFQKIIRFGTLARHLAVKRSKQFRLCSKLVEFPRICWVVLLCMWVWAVWVAAEPVATLQQLQSAVWTSVNLSTTSTIIPNSCAACASMQFPEAIHLVTSTPLWVDAILSLSTASIPFVNELDREPLGKRFPLSTN